MNSLDQLKQWTVVVADTGDFSAMQDYKPEDATTNPSLILAQAGTEAGKKVIQEAIDKTAKSTGGKKPQDADWVSKAAEQTVVLVGYEILKVIPGLVSVEVDATFSHDQADSVACARRYIRLFEELGIKRDRVLIKMAATWAGCRAAEELAKDNIRCNMTLVFCLAQAAAAAEAGAYLISPFVGRILDWHKKKQPEGDFEGEKDPGVQSVKGIYAYYKKHQLATVVMAASFRNTGEIKCLAGCDKMTISPKLLEELKNDKDAKFDRALEPKKSVVGEVPDKLSLTEEKFKKMLSEDPMAHEKLQEGIQKFTQDVNSLKDLIKSMSS